MDKHPRDLEGHYFNARDARLRQRMRDDVERRATEERHREKLSEASGTDDTRMLDRMRGLGLDGDIAPALPLLPLVGVAWADDTVTHAERTAVMKLAEARGIAPDSKAAMFLASILEERPSPELREIMLELLHDMVRVQGKPPQSLIEACETIAAASGGILGLGIGNTISDEERAEIARIAKAIGPEAEAQLTARLKGSD